MKIGDRVQLTLTSGTKIRGTITEQASPSAGRTRWMVEHDSDPDNYPWCWFEYRLTLI